MSRNLQNCYCDFDAAERRAKQLEAKDGYERLVYADAAGYWTIKLTGAKCRVIPRHANSSLSDVWAGETP